MRGRLLQSRGDTELREVCWELGIPLSLHHESNYNIIVGWSRYTVTLTSSISACLVKDALEVDFLVGSDLYRDSWGTSEGGRWERSAQLRVSARVLEMAEDEGEDCSMLWYHSLDVENIKSLNYNCG